MTESAAILASFEVAIVPDALLVTTVRRFVGELCRRTFANAETTSKVLVATHELFENAMRYASREACHLRVEVCRLEQDVAVRIVTRNHVTEDRRASLEHVFEAMHASSDRLGFYRGLLDRVARGVEGAGLGLGRVHAEAELDVKGRFEGEDVVIEAEGRFPLVHLR